MNGGLGGSLPAVILFACLTKASFRRLTLKCAPVFGTECRSGSAPMSKSFARGLQSTKPVANDRREFAIAVYNYRDFQGLCIHTVAQAIF